MKRNSGRLTSREREQRRRDIALGLEVLAMVREPGEVVEQQVMADVCGCSRETIRKMENGALEKMRRAAKMMEN